MRLNVAPTRGIAPSTNRTNANTMRMRLSVTCMSSPLLNHGLEDGREGVPVPWSMGFYAFRIGLARGGCGPARRDLNSHAPTHRCEGGAAGYRHEQRGRRLPSPIVWRHPPRLPISPHRHRNRSIVYHGLWEGSSGTQRGRLQAGADSRVASLGRLKLKHLGSGQLLRPELPPADQAWRGAVEMAAPIAPPTLMSLIKYTMRLPKRTILSAVAHGNLPLFRTAAEHRAGKR